MPKAPILRGFGLPRFSETITIAGGLGIGAGKQRHLAVRSRFADARKDAAWKLSWNVFE
jgi:hypothetical protein